MQDVEGLAKMLENAAGAIRELSQKVNALQKIHDPDETLEKGLCHLKLRPRSKNCLEYEGIITVGQLTQATARDILDIRNAGQVVISDIRVQLGKAGLKLKGD